jgi:hypothetical protein
MGEDYEIVVTDADLREKPDPRADADPTNEIVESKLETIRDQHESIDSLSHAAAFAIDRQAAIGHMEDFGAEHGLSSEEVADALEVGLSHLGDDSGSVGFADDDDEHEGVQFVDDDDDGGGFDLSGVNG